jgi:type IV pilus assembly protein PilO
MSLMPKSQRDQGMVAVGMVAVALTVAYYMYGYTPKAAELEKMGEHVEALAKANDRAKAEMAKGSANELRAQAKMYADNLDLMRQLVPTGNEVPALLEQVSTAARRVGLDIGAVEPEPVIPGDEFDTYRYKITIVGGYHDLGQFLTNVGSLTRIIAPVNLKLMPATADQAKRHARNGSSALQSDFEMQTYVAKASVAQPAGGPQKGGPKT